MDEHSFPILKVLFINGTTTSLSDAVKLFKNAKMVLTTLQYGIESDRLIRTTISEHLPDWSLNNSHRCVVASFLRMTSAARV